MNSTKVDNEKTGFFRKLWSLIEDNKLIGGVTLFLVLGALGWINNELNKSPEIAVEAISARLSDASPDTSGSVGDGLGDFRSDEKVTVDLEIKNDGDGDVSGARLIAGDSACENAIGVSVPAKDTTKVSCEVLAGSLRGAIAIIDSDNRELAKTEPLNITINEAPCPALRIDGRELDAPTYADFAQRWNEAIAATVANTTETCQALGEAWQLYASPTGATQQIGLNSSINWELDFDDRLTQITVSVKGPDDSLMTDTVKGVFGAAIAYDNAEAENLSDTWASECSGNNTAKVMYLTDVDKSLYAEFCPR